MKPRDTDVGTADAPRTPGRPRSREADEAILTAALDLLIERGAGWTSIEQVARRAGVTRATVYRRFPDQTALLIRAVERAYRDAEPDALNWPDVDSMVATWAQQLGEPRGRKLMRRLYGAVDELPELLRAYGDVHGHRRSEAVRATLERARAAGQFPPDSDPEVLQRILSGVALHHLGTYPDTTGEEEVRAYFLAALRQAGYRPAAPERKEAEGHE